MLKLVHDRIVIQSMTRITLSPSKRMAERLAVVSNIIQIMDRGMTLHGTCIGKVIAQPNLSCWKTLLKLNGIRD